MSFSLVLNSTNVVSGSNNNTYRYNFIQGSFNIPENSELSVSSVVVPYSFFNISAVYGNNSFVLSYPANSAYVTATITLPDGFYTINTLNSYIQQICITNGFYLVNSSGQYVYYITVNPNATYYANQFVFSKVPTVLPAGWTNPGGLVLPTVSVSPYININNSRFGTYIGFTNGYYPMGSAIGYSGANSSVSNNSNQTPVGSNVNSILMRCSIVNNRVGVMTDLLDAFPINNTFGSNITYIPPFQKWVKASSGSFNNMIIQFVDQNFNPIVMNDNNILITILIKK